MINKKNVIATCDEICEYIDKEVKPGDIIRLSLGRCYIPGKVITNNQGVLQINVNGDIIKGLSCIDVQDLKEFLVEVEHESGNEICIIEAKND
jgi:hypothetical protein